MVFPSRQVLEDRAPLDCDRQPVAAAELFEGLETLLLVFSMAIHRTW
jgi:hypothetical protein